MNFKKIAGLLLIVAGVGIGVYAGLVWAFIGGIVDVIQSVRAVDLDATAVVFGVLKILFAGFIGDVSAFIFVFPGFSLLTASQDAA